MTCCRLTPAAARDIALILEVSMRMFGPIQFRLYGRLIDKAIGTLESQPEPPGSRRRDDLGNNVRTYHLEHAAGRRGAASHLLVYRRETDGSTTVLRVLHDRMNPHMHMPSVDF